MNRRGFLQGILAAGVAPYVSTAAGVLMPVKSIINPFDAMKRQALEFVFPVDGVWYAWCHPDLEEELRNMVIAPGAICRAGGTITKMGRA